MNSEVGETGNGLRGRDLRHDATAVGPATTRKRARSRLDPADPREVDPDNDHDGSARNCGFGAIAELLCMPTEDGGAGHPVVLVENVIRRPDTSALRR